MRECKIFKRMLALVLTAVLVLGMAPTVTLPAAAAEQASLTVTERVADPESVDNWQDYYGDNALLPDGTRGISTWKAGGVWTDKSVYTDSSAFPSAVTLEDENAFLVALSALASTKEVVGQSTAPTDTVLVLDLSQSMDNSSSVPDMIEAANDSIHALLSMNTNNRVGVVLYSSTVTEILPLDRYTTTTTSTEVEDGETVTKYHYLTVTSTTEGGGPGGPGGPGGGSSTVDTTVSVASGTLNSSGVKPSGSKQTVGGTYIQYGLYEAYEMFTDVTDKGVVQSGAQAGKQRTPIIILMSDGAPTYGTTEYDSVTSNYNLGNGSNTTDRLTFLTQLTAAWVKGAVQSHYNNTAVKFYTLGLGTSTSTEATAVLNPSGTGTTLTTWWSNFLTNTPNSSGQVLIYQQQSSGGPGGPNGQQESWYLDDDTNGYIAGMNYVDQYWSADDADAMVEAFQQIIAQIGLQSVYSATLVESGDANLDGYITVEDELGSMMEVKDVKGILLGGTLFSGEELAKNLETLFGTVDEPSEAGDEFIRSIKARLNLTDTSAAQQLVAAAYADGQLAYDATTGDYSNYIGWYSDADDNYLGFWDKDSGITAEGAPEGTVYINRTYTYLGRTDVGGGITDMMYISATVCTELATSRQMVRFKIPSALIPMVVYKVEAKGESIETATELTLTVEETDPIQLVYEVGLPDDVNNVNIAQKVAEYLANGGSHIHQNSDGAYEFFANNWDDNFDGVAPVVGDLSNEAKQDLTQYIAESHFIPNTENERFYIQEDSVVYTKSGNTYTPVTSGITAGGTYYFARTIVTVTGAHGAATAQTQYELIHPETMSDLSVFQKNDTTGYWEIKGGTIRQALSALGLAKSENKTGTIAVTDHLWVDVIGESATDYNVYSFLGNNGKFTVTPATGIKVTKEVTQLADGAQADEKFAITVAIDGTGFTPVISDENGVLLEESVYTVAQSGGKTLVTLQLADGEYAYITGVPADAEFTVTEAANDNYQYTYTGATQTVAATIVEGVVTNAPIQPGSLFITKRVIHSIENEIAPTDYEFSFEVTFVDKNGDPIANTTFQLVNSNDATLTQLTTDASGVMRGKLKHSETVLIQGIPAGAKVTVTEVSIPDTYAVAYVGGDTGADTYTAGNAVTIVSEQTAGVIATNTYTPEEVEVSLDLTVEKILKVDQQPDEDMSFTFRMERWNGQAWELVKTFGPLSWSRDEIQTTQDNIKTVTGSVFGTFTAPGEYTYRFYEVKPDTPVEGLTYDRTVHTALVTVTDDDGQLVAVVTDGNGNRIANLDADDALEYQVSFTNEFNTAPVSIDITKAVADTSSNPSTTKAGFTFVAVQTDEDWAPLTGGSTLTVHSDSTGSARMAATYTAAGDYYYILSETAGTAAGWSYSADSYKIQVTVTDDGTGNLSATIIINGQNQQSDNAAVTFTNTYDPTDVTLELNTLVDKSLTGRTLAAGEFQFAIFKRDGAKFDANGNLTNLSEAVAVGTNDADGNVTFTPEALTYSKVGVYEYDIVEVKGDKGGVSYDSTVYNLSVEVTGTGDGTLKLAYHFVGIVDKAVTFQNTYTTQPTQVVIRGAKSLTVNSGVKQLGVGEYTFGLYDAQGTLLQTTQNLANGSFRFQAIGYTSQDVGSTYTYTVKEIAPDGSTDGSYTAGGVTYSGQSFTVTVTITDNGDGTLRAEVTGNGAENVAFVNTYNSKPVTVTLPGIKNLHNRILADGEFRFQLYSTDATFAQRTLISDQITHDASGSFSIALGQLGMGYHYFAVKEVIPEERAPGIQYDASEYHITVQVTDAGNGQMAAMTSIHKSGAPGVNIETIRFGNAYVPADAQLILEGTKTYNGGKALVDDQFSVGLYEGTTLLQTAPVKADGSFTFEPLVYTAEDVGQTYTYTVQEIIPDGAVDNGDGTKTFGNHSYDATVYTVVVSVSDVDKDGALEISKTVNGNADGVISFTNTFVPDEVVASIYIQKHVVNKTEPGIGLDGFVFVMEHALAAYDDTSDADGKAGFQITLGAQFIGQTLTFKVYEKNTGKTGVTYDQSVYNITVKVEQNPDGSLKTIINGAEIDSVTLDFTNTYEKSQTPNTGDTFPVIALGSLLVISGAALVVLMLSKKKKGGKYAS